jgi:hypothetical protein
VTDKEKREKGLGRARKGKEGREANLTPKQPLAKSILEEPEQLERIIRLQAIFRGRLTRHVHPDPRVKNFYRRLQIANEILKTEESYVNGLRCLIKIYLANLKALPQDVLPPAAIKDIFSNA